MTFHGSWSQRITSGSHCCHVYEGKALRNIVSPRRWGNGAVFLNESCFFTPPPTQVQHLRSLPPKFAVNLRRPLSPHKGYKSFTPPTAPGAVFWSSRYRLLFQTPATETSIQEHSLFSKGFPSMELPLHTSPWRHTPIQARPHTPRKPPSQSKRWAGPLPELRDPPCSLSLSFFEKQTNRLFWAHFRRFQNILVHGKEVCSAELEGPLRHFCHGCHTCTKRNTLFVHLPLTSHRNGSKLPRHCTSAEQNVLVFSSFPKQYWFMTFKNAERRENENRENPPLWFYHPKIRTVNILEYGLPVFSPCT